MNTGSYVFTQLIKLLPKEGFDWIVKQYDGDKYVKHFTSWNHLLVMMFGQLYGCERPLLLRICKSRMGAGADLQSGLFGRCTIAEMACFKEEQVQRTINICRKACNGEV